MNDQAKTCHTFDAAMEKAIELENDIYRQFYSAIRTVRNKGAKEILQEAALEGLNHKHHLEKALIEGDIEEGLLEKTIPTMDLDHRFGLEQVDSDADARSALAHAIHLVNTSVEFYKAMCEACTGAPMATVFKQIENEQRQHLQKLEDSYEEHCLTEN